MGVSNCTWCDELVECKHVIMYAFKHSILCSMTFAPGKKQAHSMTGIAWDRDLDMDLDRLKTFYNIHSLISLMRPNVYVYMCVCVCGVWTDSKQHTFSFH